MKDGYLFIILSIIVLFFFACTRRKNDDMTHLVKEWEKKDAERALRHNRGGLRIRRA